MKILYIAKHGQLNNDDEGAIYKGLTLHDCSVDKFDLVSFEDDKKRLDEIDEAYDYVLFHKLPCEDYVEYVCNKWDGICWYFDPRILRQGLDDCVPTWSDSNRIKDFSFIGTTCPNKNCSCGYSTRSNYITRLQSDFKNWKPDITNIYWKESLTKVCHLNKIMLAMPPATDLY